MTNEEREALIARARATVHPTSDDTGERQTRALLSALDEARGQLAALHAAWANVLRREVKSLYGGGGYEQRSLWDLRDTFDDTAAAAKVYTDAVRAPVERERDAAIDLAAHRDARVRAGALREAVHVLETEYEDSHRACRGYAWTFAGRLRKLADEAEKGGA